MGSKSSGTPAVDVLIAAEVGFALHTYEWIEGPGSYGEAVAHALGVEPDRLFKTLVTAVDGQATLAIVPVSTRLSPKALAKAAGGKKAEMVAPTNAERLTGYVVGGISPFGQRRRLPTFVDETAGLFDTVYVSGGRRGLQLEVSPADLVALLGAAVADLTS